VRGVATSESAASAAAQYEIFFNEDESEAVVFERYRDADAAIEHHFRADILGHACTRFTRVEPADSP
jgi:quinol monooxygenase YgiN